MSPPGGEIRPTAAVLGFFCIAAKETRRSSGETSILFRIFRRLRTATYFARGGKVGKTPPGDAAFGKDLRLTPWSFRRRFPPDPPVYGGVR